MGFKVVIIGSDEEGEETRETVFEAKEGRRVTKVHVLTRTGESATIGVDPDQGDMALTFDYAAPATLHLSDLDHLKPGYESNLDGDAVRERQERLEELRGSTPVAESFTQDAVDAQRELEEHEADEEPEEPADEVEPDNGFSLEREPEGSTP